MNPNVDKWVKAINYRELPLCLSDDEIESLKRDRIVIVTDLCFGDSEAQGAIEFEFNQKKFFFGDDGYVVDDGYNQRNPNVRIIREAEAKDFAVVRKEDGNVCKAFETDIPHGKIDLMIEGEKVAIGIIFSQDDLK